MKSDGEGCNRYADSSKQTAAATRVRDQQNQKRQSVEPNRAIERFEMIVKIFQPQLSLLRINGRTEGVQTFTEPASGATEIEAIGLHITRGHCLQFDLDRRELRFAVVPRKLRGNDPRVGFALRRWNNQKRASIHDVRQKGEPIAYCQRLLLHTIERFLSALQGVGFVCEPLQFR